MGGGPDQHRPTRPPGRRLSRLVRWLGTPDGRAIALLVGIPLVAFVIPAVLGIPAIAGDNVIQNFPLRVFTGEQLRHGHLPLWNPLIWSGSPLLAGLNAGSAYPLTWVFAVVPALAGWVLNLLVAYWVGGLACYALLRQYRLEPLPSLLGAATFAFSGAMVGQMVHLPIIQGWAWMPLVVLAELGLGRSLLGTPAMWGPAGMAQGPSGELRVARPGAAGGTEGWSPWAWTVLLALLLGMILLTGEPRGMAEAEIVASVVAVWILVRPYGGLRHGGPGLGPRAKMVGHLAVAALWAAALGAVQLLPGLTFITGSERASESLSYFGSGSLYPSWTALLAVPDLFGGDGFLHQPVFFNSYNLPEVTGYVGLLPLAAALALLTRSWGNQRDPRSSDWGLWLVLGGLGLLLTWGTYTPLGVIFGHIPFFNKTRLQSRNLGIVDLSLAVLLAFWVQRAWGASAREAGLAGWRRFATLAPLAATAVLCVVAIAIPGPLESAFRVPAARAGLGRYLTPWFIASLVIAVAALALLWWWRRLGATTRRRALCALVVVDILVFTASSSTGFSPGNAQIEPNRATAVSVLGNRGRTAFVDPSVNVDTLSIVGEPDLNVFTQVPSVQGYGSLIAGDYGNVTGTHFLDTMDTCALARGVFTPLRLATILTPPSELTVPIPPTGRLPTPTPPCPGAAAPGRPGSRTWYFGQPLAVRATTLVPESPGPTGTLARGQPTVGLLGASGSLRFPAQTRTPTADGGWSVRLEHPAQAVGLVVRGPARAVSDQSQVTTASGQSYVLDGAIQAAVGQQAWRYTGIWRGFARFEAVTLRPPVWAAGNPKGTSVRLVRSTSWGQAVVAVDTKGTAEVVRSEAASPGWSVAAVPAGGGAARTLPVHTVGLVQGVKVPPGRWILTYQYWPPRLDEGLAASAAALAALVVALALWWRRRRRAPSERAVGHGTARASGRATGSRPERQGV